MVKKSRRYSVVGTNLSLTESRIKKKKSEVGTALSIKICEGDLKFIFFYPFLINST